ncbi:hypothetical protein PR048_000378 [Dryococelus australis]|uniref:Uncharacterized protein n=1 Tax=Dryococelus australis TaxID=614101 RepID=A0ABQ9IEF2_9NEOP|nr:hypothetical protein PR048_000378 [Dryococelus australis]
MNPFPQIHKSMHYVMMAEKEEARQGWPLRQVTQTIKPGLAKDPNEYNLPAAVNEDAAIFVGDIPPMRYDIWIYQKDRPLQAISPLNALGEPMTHPLLFPHGKHGRADNAASVTIGTKMYDNRHVVPYNPHLLLKYQCHSNVKVRLSFQVTQYLYKYIYKGNDSAVLQVGNIVRDEIIMYLVHWRGHATSICTSQHSSTTTLSASCFPTLAVVSVGQGSVLNLTYTEKQCMWKAREKVDFNTISRIHQVSPPANEELLYLRLLLQNVAGHTSFKELHTVCHNVHPTYKLACQDLLLLDEDDIYQVTMYEVARWSVPGLIAKLSVLLLGWA